LACPTARAAHRLNEVCSGILAAHEAQSSSSKGSVSALGAVPHAVTVHRLLGYGVSASSPAGQAALAKAAAIQRGEEQTSNGQGGGGSGRKGRSLGLPQVGALSLGNKGGRREEDARGRDGVLLTNFLDGNGSDQHSTHGDASDGNGTTSGELQYSNVLHSGASVGHTSAESDAQENESGDDDVMDEMPSGPSAPSGGSASKKGSGSDAGVRSGPFLFHRGNPLPYDAILVDEASMLDLQLARALMEAMPVPKPERDEGGTKSGEAALDV